MKKHAMLFATACILACSCAHADGNKLTLLDQDQNGLISLVEAIPDVTISSLFIDLDTNRDGMIDAVELRRVAEVKRSRESALTACSAR